MNQTKRQEVRERVVALHQAYHSEPIPFAAVLAEFPEADDETLAAIIEGDLDAMREWDFPRTFRRYRIIPDLERKPLTLGAMVEAMEDANDVLNAMSAESCQHLAEVVGAASVSESAHARAHDRAIRGTPRRWLGRVADVRVSFVGVLVALVLITSGWVGAYRYYDVAQWQALQRKRTEDFMARLRDLVPDQRSDPTTVGGASQ